jgi:hypothetical protein
VAPDLTVRILGRLQLDGTSKVICKRFVIEFRIGVNWAKLCGPLLSPPQEVP